MKIRTANVVAIGLVGIAAGVAVPAITADSAYAAACLAKPNATAPQGSHWFYRVDRATKRNCWYVRAVGPKSATSATASAEPVAPKPAAAPTAALRPAVANARAEFDPAPADNLGRTPATSLLSPGTLQSVGPTDPQPGTAPGWQLASRWSNQADAAAAAAAADRNAGAAPQQVIATADAPPPALVAEPPAKQPTALAGRSIWTLLGALVAALAVAALTVAAVMKFGGARPAVRRVGNGRPDIWGAAEPEPPLDAQQVEPPMNWIKIARERHAAIERSDEVERLLSGAARRPS